MKYSEIEAQLNWEKVKGLIPAIVQDCETFQVLMLGYMNKEALKMTCETEEITFYSRSKNRLWRKGESSGHTLSLVSLYPDCDQDSLLLLAKPKGSTCHLGNRSCFGESEASKMSILFQLEALIEERYLKRLPGSYVTTLFEEGVRRMAQKVGEEGVELALAGISGSKEDLIYETADLFFHTLVLLKERDITLASVLQELQRRAK